jgi:hypothetical protein
MPFYKSPALIPSMKALSLRLNHLQKALLLDTIPLAFKFQHMNFGGYILNIAHLYMKILKNDHRVWECGLEVQCLPNVHKALSSIPSTEKKKNQI